MSNPSQATVIARIAPESRGHWRAFRARMADFWAACLERREARLRAVDLHQVSESELRDMGLPPDLLSEVRARCDYERSRMKQLDGGYW